MILDYVIFLCCGFVIFSIIILVVSTAYLYFALRNKKLGSKISVKKVPSKNNKLTRKPEKPEALDAEFTEIK